MFLSSVFNKHYQVWCLAVAVIGKIWLLVQKVDGFSTQYYEQVWILQDKLQDLIAHVLKHKVKINRQS